MIARRQLLHEDCSNDNAQKRLQKKIVGRGLQEENFRGQTIAGRKIQEDARMKRIAGRGLQKEDCGQRMAARRL